MIDHKYFMSLEDQRQERIVKVETTAFAVLLFIASVWTAFEVGQSMATYECASAAPGAQLWLTSE